MTYSQAQILPRMPLMRAPPRMIIDTRFPPPRPGMPPISPNQPPPAVRPPMGMPPIGMLPGIPPPVNPAIPPPTERPAPVTAEPSYHPSSRSQSPPLTESEVEEIMKRNRAVSRSAISRAVSDASAGTQPHIKAKFHCIYVFHCFSTYR